MSQMRKTLSATALAVLMALATTTAGAATPTDFYLGLLRRGAADVDAGRYDRAIDPLRIAAFGLVESIEYYQTALVYLAVASDKLNMPQAAREAARRVAGAQRVERRYATLDIPPGVRSAFESIVATHLGAAEASALERRQSSSQTAGAVSPSADLRTSSPAPAQTAETTAAPKQTPPPQTEAKKPPPVQPPAQKAPASVETQAATAPAPTEREPARTAPAATPPTRPQTTEPQPATTSKETAPQTPPENKPEPVPAPPVKSPAANPPEAKAATPKPEPKQTPASPERAKEESPSVQQPSTNAAPAVAEANPAPASSSPPANPPAVPLTAGEVSERLREAEIAIEESRLPDARRIYGRLVSVPGLSRETLLRIAEGSYRSREFSTALDAFGRIGALQKGEEPFRYYIAVSLYELGRYEMAQAELQAALPFIELTPDVVRYRAKIEGALR